MITIGRLNKKMFRVTSVQYFETAKEALETVTPPSVTEIMEVNGEQELLRTIEDLNNIVAEQQPAVDADPTQVETEEELVPVEIKLSENPELAKALDEAGELSEEDKAADTITVGVSKEDAETMEALEKSDEPSAPEPEPETAGSEGEKVSGDEPSQPENTEDHTIAEGEPAGEGTPAQTV